MDQKSKTILLIVVALAVWGYSALEWLNYYETDNQSVTANNTILIAPTKLITLQKKEAITLNLNYRDPFLNERKSKKTYNQNTTASNQNNATENVQKKEPIKVAVKWPKIKYVGIINGLGLLNIDSRDYIVKTNDLIKKITIKSITDNHVVLILEGEEKVFEK